MKISNRNPNFSVILPVGCNAKCGFCYWKQGKGLTLNKFECVCDSLPFEFESISITGGEPTLERQLLEYLFIARRYFKKVVLNTNGSLLNDAHVELCDHVNISRHHIEDEQNAEVFGTLGVPDTVQLMRLARTGKVTLNCVLPEGFSDSSFVRDYVKFAKTIGANVAFRKEVGDLTLLPVDSPNTLRTESTCPVCAQRLHEIDGIQVYFKYGLKETFNPELGIHELILQPNGDLTADWAGNQKVELSDDWHSFFGKPVNLAKPIQSNCNKHCRL